MPIDDISKATPEIAKHHPRFVRNRDFADGEEAVKAKNSIYLPAANPADDDATYNSHLFRTRFFPAASKTLQGWVGLIKRKPDQLGTKSEIIGTLCELLTPDYLNLNELTEWLIRETLITNFTGLLVDHPSRDEFTGLSAANAFEQGYRPFIAGYTAESILELKPGLVGGKRQLVRVRLMEQDCTRIRELMVNQGIYQVRIWTKDGEAFIPGPIQTPLVNGKALGEIPFVLVSTSEKLTPQPSLLQHVVDLNLQLYIQQGLLSNVHYTLSAPIPTIRGISPLKDKDDNYVLDKDGQLQFPDFPVAPGSLWLFESKDTVAEYLEFKGQGAATLENSVKEIKDELRIAGHSIVAPDKPAPEAPETQMIYRAAEMAILASFARTISAKMLRALKLLARWADPAAEADLTFSVNKDFVPQSLSPQAISALQGLWQAGAITHDQLLLCLKDGEVLSPALDVAAEIEATKVEVADRPSTEAL
ncbi:DUF4055 domain-containing protein [Sphingobium sp. WTD-1]|uniref:DUF4055 domain-containing protein n=1 Tax=Sphingobium sp. WTD-1 TaxID=2979467 RepID=UPI0024DE74F7|nr:DUF4055 domain-containing protein [Sphingobium sp. WTD-1]WIA55055.1 DUF4055 domain-containing protein [Sphingobium sp. WTD-1]